MRLDPAFQHGAPSGVVIKPLAADSAAALLHRDALRCGKCGALINKFCCLERGAFGCALCGEHNKALALAATAAELRLQPELAHAAVEYADPTQPPSADGASAAPSFTIFVVDECASAAQLDPLRAAVDEWIQDAPAGSERLLALISYGATVSLYMLTPPHAQRPAAIVFPGGVIGRAEQALLGAKGSLCVVPAHLAADPLLAALAALTPAREPADLAAGFSRSIA
jgi:hypothetical protein